jgi:AcrR family transcriptional regulator
LRDALTRPAKSTRKAKGDGHLRRAEILAAAETIFVRDGYHGATIRKIAEEVGVSSTALYMYFRDKDEILLEICETAAEDLLVQFNEIAVRPTDALSRARSMLAAYMRFGLVNPNTCMLAFGSGPGQLTQNRVQSQLARPCYDLFRQSVADIAGEGRLRIDDDKLATHLLWAACHGLIALHASRPDAGWEARETLISGMLDGLFEGLATR